jgi:hypothetical protein
MDCFFVGRLQGTKGTVWQYSAADVASGYAWAFLKASDRNPRSRWTQDSFTWSRASFGPPAGGCGR